MSLQDVPEPGMPPPQPFPLLVAATLQDHLMTASNDLERLQRLLDGASEDLMGHFYGAREQLTALLHQAAHVPGVDTSALHAAMEQLGGAVTALQFQDMASQLITHTNTRLRSVADQIARDAMGAEDAEGTAVVMAEPLRPNPVTQDEMDAGSVELF